MYFLSNLDVFPNNLANFSDYFHLQMKDIEIDRRYLGYCDELMMGDYCYRESENIRRKLSKSKLRNFLNSNKNLFDSKILNLLCKIVYLFSNFYKD